MMGFPRWFLPITAPDLIPPCRAIGKFNLDQGRKRPLELFCVKSDGRQGSLSWMFTSSSASIEPN
jgi:hypothetical protein